MHHRAWISVRIIEVTLKCSQNVCKTSIRPTKCGRFQINDIGVFKCASRPNIKIKLKM